jgi:prophage regulatory protein
MQPQELPLTGFVRIKQIVGDPNANPPIPPIYPVARSTWWQGVRDGRYPRPVQLSRRVTAWRVDDIRALLSKGAA